MSVFTFPPQPSPLLRRQYLLSLEEPQEFFLEEMVESGQFWTHEDGSYGVINGESLVEFFSADPACSKARLRALHVQTGFSSALAKSFDRDFVLSCERLGWRAFVVGVLFRERKPRHQAPFDRAEIRSATRADAPALWRINKDFFESEDEIAHSTRSGALWTALVDGEIAGCGVANRVIQNGVAVDVGMMVAPDLRRRGLGTFIVCEIANKIEMEGLRPICGCGARNLASKATLEKAGFASKHQLLSFRI